MSIDNLNSDQRRKAEAIKLGLRKLTPQKIAQIRDSIRKYSSLESAPYSKFSRDHPITFGTEVLRLEPNSVQVELGMPWYTEDQKMLFDAVASNRRVLALSGNGVGKSYSAAIISLWLYNRGYTVLTTAPTLMQVTDILWAQMRAMKKKADKGLGGAWQPKANRAEYDELHFMQGFTVQTDMASGVSSSFSGRHGHKMAIVMDEVVGMTQDIIESCDVICIGPEDVVFGIGNPTEVTAPIRRASEVERADGTKLWKVVHISGENHPNVRLRRTVIPGAVSWEMVQDQLAKSGSRDGSRYKSSVLGQWPDDTPDSLIPKDWIRAAQARGKKDREDDYRGVAVGVDVAGEGGDLTPVMCVSKSKIFMPKLSVGKAWIQGRDTQHCVDLVKRVIREVPDVRSVGIDDTGIGQGPRAQLQRDRAYFPKFLAYKRSSMEEYNKERQATVVGLNFASSPDPASGERFARLKDQLWWNLREAFRNGEIDLPSDEEIRAWDLPNGNSLVDQLSTALYIQDGQGRIVVLDKRGAAGGQHKEKTRSLPDKSPDLAHALMIAWDRYSKLPTGSRPIRNLIELKQIEMQVAKEKMKKRLGINGPRRSSSTNSRELPWNRH